MCITLPKNFSWPWTINTNKSHVNLTLTCDNQKDLDNL